MNEPHPERDEPRPTDDETVFLEDLIPREDPVAGARKVIFGILPKRFPLRPHTSDGQDAGEL